jgi:hypothetical protein
VRPVFRFFRHAVAFAALAGQAAADSRIDGIEHIYGATNINAVTGHGRLAAGVSADGDVTVLTWPNPSYCDQLAYLSSNDFHARSLPRLGAPEGAGIFLGLRLKTSGDGAPQVTWLRDRSTWNIAQSYGDEDGPNVVTRYTSLALALTVTVTDAIQPTSTDTETADVMVRDVAVQRQPQSAVTAAWLLTYANLSPLPPNSRIAELPLVDWLFDGSNDFAAVWDEASGSVIHFHPQDQLVYRQLTDVLVPPPVSYGPIGDQLTRGAPSAAELRDLAGGLDQTYAAGSYIALTTRPAADQHQIGFDATPLCGMRDTIADNILKLPQTLPGVEPPVSPAAIDLLRCRRQDPLPMREGWTYQPTDALLDAGDGDLEGSGIAAGEVNEALRTPLVFADAGGSVARAAVVLGLAPTAAQARTAAAAVSDAAQVVAASGNALDAWLSSVHLPSAPGEARAVARRALINLRVGTDRATGSIVASISRQPPYGLDWPRDGAFFDVALDISGQSAIVDRHADLLAAWQRRAPAAPTLLIDQRPPRDPRTGHTATYPAGAWEMNYYPDGTTGGPLRFEIDNTAFALWSIVTHAGWVADATSYLNGHWDVITHAADLLADWRDPETGLQAPASEDDNGAYTQTLHGAVTVYGALDAGARAARLLGRDAEAQRWEARGCELRHATEALLYDGEAMRFVSRPGEAFDPSHAPTGETAWMVWPMRVFPWDDPRVVAQLRSDLQIITPTIELQTEGGSYSMKSTVPLALVFGSDGDLGPHIAALRDLLAEKHATPQTRHFGESMLVVQGPDGPQASQRVATPHLWEGILFYLSAMALDDPSAFERFEQAVPASHIPRLDESCAAEVAPSPTPTATASATPSATAIPSATSTAPATSTPTPRLSAEPGCELGVGAPASRGIWPVLGLAIVALLGRPRVRRQRRWRGGCPDSEVDGTVWPMIRLGKRPEP